MIRIKRAFEPLQKGDGYRVLVDRLWPRGKRKEDLQIDRWLKDLAPSASLRKCRSKSDYCSKRAEGKLKTTTTPRAPRGARGVVMVDSSWLNGNMTRVQIPEDELTFTSSRSSGPGGQNVNKTSTRVTLHFDVENSPSLTSEQKDLLCRKLATRISKRGVLQVVSQKHRSQAANKREATERFFQLVESALEKPRPRKATKISRSAHQRRLEEKSRRSEIKKRRSAGVSWDE